MPSSIGCPIFVAIFLLQITSEIRADLTTFPNSMNLNDQAAGNEMPYSRAHRLWELMIAKNVTIRFEFKQRRNNEGTLVSFYGGILGRQILLKISTSTKNQKIDIRFRTPGGSLKLYSNAIDDLNHGKWHSLIFALQGHRFHLIFDCKQVQNQEDLDLRFSPERALRVIIGGKSMKQHRFKGELREITADVGLTTNKYCDNLELSPQSMPSSMRSLDQHLFASFISSIANTSTNSDQNSAVDYLKHRVGHLENQFKHWRFIVQRHEKQLKRVQLHQMGCQLNKFYSVDPDERLKKVKSVASLPILLADGDTWRNQSSCIECQCHQGVAHCRPIGCPLRPSCSHPMKVANSCCPVCGQRCYYNGRYYHHAQQFWPKSCVQCTCNDTLTECEYHRNERCPSIDCSEHRRYTPTNRCCPICIDDDFCSKEPCDQNANCTNERHGRRCRCKEGFFGNGEVGNCFDVDECHETTGRRRLANCANGTRCINLPGGYRCNCLIGHVRMDEFNCLNVVPV